MRRGTASMARVLALACALTAFGTARVASAAIGYVSGTWRFWNSNGNFCPTAANCTDSLYPESMFDTWQPIANARVRLYDDAGTQIGAAVTDSTGYFVAQWTRSTMPAQFRVRVYPYEANARFYIAQTNGQLYNVYTGLFTTTSSTPSSPQSIGTRSIGSSSAPNGHFNAYWAGERLWREVYSLVGVLSNNFTNVEVRGFADDIPDFLGLAPTSVSVGPTKQVQLDGSAMLKPQARIMHELGHIASYVTKAFLFSEAYEYNSSSGWSQASAEYASAAFEEAFATHGGNVAFWGDDAVTPTTCNSTSDCYNSSGVPFSNSDVEATSYPYTVNNCVTDEGRRPISHMRFLWDVFDHRNDADGDSYCANCGDYWFHFALLSYYSIGTDNHQTDEPWDFWLSSVTEPDGRGSSDYTYHYNQNLVDVDVLRIDNCSPL